MSNFLVENVLCYSAHYLAFVLEILTNWILTEELGLGCILTEHFFTCKNPLSYNRYIKSIY
jgi:hypothetical protein